MLNTRTEQPPGPTAQQGSLIPLVVLGGSMITFQAVVILPTPLLVEISDTFQISVAAAGQIRSVIAASAAVFSLLVGPISDAIGRRPVLAGGLLAVAAASLFTAAAPSFELLLAAQLVAGVGTAALFATSLASVPEYFPPGRQGWAMGRVIGSTTLAWLVGAPAAGLIAEHLGWRWSYVGVPFLLSMAMLALLPSLKRAPTPPRARQTARGGSALAAGLGFVVGNSSARAWVAAELFSSASWGAMLTYIGAFCFFYFELTPSQIGIILIGNAVTFMISSLVSHRLADRYGTKQTVVVGLGILGVLGLAMMSITVSAPVTFILFAAQGLLSGARAALSITLGLAQGPRFGGTMMGLRSSTQQLGFVLGAATGGLVIATVGYPGMAPLLGLPMFVSAAIILKSVREAEQGHSPPG